MGIFSLIHVIGACTRAFLKSPNFAFKDVRLTFPHLQNSIKFQYVTAYFKRSQKAKKQDEITVKFRNLIYSRLTIEFQLFMISSSCRLNPLTYDILRLRQLRGEGGLFRPDLENMVTVNGLI